MATITFLLRFRILQRNQIYYYLKAFNFFSSPPKRIDILSRIRNTLSICAVECAFLFIFEFVTPNMARGYEHLNNI